MRSFTATADFCWNEGHETLQKGDFINAIHFYTKGININCNDKELKAKLYNNRAIAHFKLGNHQDSQRDAEAATELNPTFLEAIVRGATSCVKLKKFEEAITWCDKGLAIDKIKGSCYHQDFSLSEKWEISQWRKKILLVMTTVVQVQVMS